MKPTPPSKGKGRSGGPVRSGRKFLRPLPNPPGLRPSTPPRPQKRPLGSQKSTYSTRFYERNRKGFSKPSSSVRPLSSVRQSSSERPTSLGSLSRLSTTTIESEDNIPPYVPKESSPKGVFQKIKRKYKKSKAEKKKRKEIEEKRVNLEREKALYEEKIDEAEKQIKALKGSKIGKESKNSQIKLLNMSISNLKRGIEVLQQRLDQMGGSSRRTQRRRTQRRRTQRRRTQRRRTQRRRTQRK